MSKFTESSLKSKTKDQIVEIALELDAQLEVATSAPLTAADVQKKVLDLKRQAQQIKDDAEKRELDHTKAIKKIEADKEVELKRLELQYNSELGVDLKELEKQYSDLEERSNKAIEELAYKLQVAETETDEKLSAIQQQVNEATSNAKDEIAKWDAKVEEVQTNTKSKIESIKQEHDRDVEQLRYDNKIIIRDENLSVVTKVAEKLGYTVVEKEDYDRLESFIATDSETVNTKISDAVKAAKSELYASEGAKYSSLKSSTDSTMALLQNDKNHLEKQVISNEQRIKDLEEQVKAFPEQLAKAVEAAKSSVNITQDAAAKR